MIMFGRLDAQRLDAQTPNGWTPNFLGLDAQSFEVFPERLLDDRVDVGDPGTTS